MKINNIAKNVHSKMLDWLSSIESSPLRERVKDSLIVSGGCITSMLLNEKVNDYDVYIRDIDVLKELVEYYLDKFDPGDSREILDGRCKYTYESNPYYNDTSNSYKAIAIRTLKENQIKVLTDGGYKMFYNDDDDRGKLPYRMVYLSDNAITLSDGIQIILRFTGDVETIHSTFDFIHATNYFTIKEGIVTNKKALESILTRELMYQGSKFPLTSIIRTRKFIKRGWNISAGEYLKIMYQISKLDLNDIDVLTEQLIGVDVVYFDRLLVKLREFNTGLHEVKDISEYLFELIDEVFSDLGHLEDDSHD